MTTTETVPSPTRCNVMLHLEPGSPRHQSLISLAEAESLHARPSMETSSSPTKSRPSEGDPAKCQPEKCQSLRASVANQQQCCAHTHKHTERERARTREKTSFYQEQCGICKQQQMRRKTRHESQDRLVILPRFRSHSPSAPEFLHSHWHARVTGTGASSCRAAFKSTLT